ncbi:glycine betaine ABC transporter substrate-binding protein [Halobellus limi]|jgi:osmoprotectant transport system substrate-binding protein|uniref:Glycine/betaine ABC transporter substrate-binding protein n=1 Tax=Halobellus limi TaxID=699433 RepID=A0A1H5ZWG7_9EURY|nr:glycine betaine ABC transporter substrate-binding protein [Halobellus limi]QCC47913.1 glycine/betaine ABC transporter substrate-binding protein [Halobellus limi]SEG40531.1 osmoprotectant transport system substrate-binding protein [Halobellus limi]
MLKRRDVLRAGCTMGAGAIAGCSGSGSQSGSSGGSSNEIVVGSKTFAENRILGYMAYEALSELTDLRVVDEIGYGATSTAWEGLVEGRLDLYWEYTGTLRLTHPPAQESLIEDPEEQARAARESIESTHDLVVLSRAPFNNTYTVVTTPEWIDETGISSLGALADHVNAGNTDQTIALGPSFYDRADGWPGLLDHYGFDPAAVEEWDENVEVVSLGLTYEFLDIGRAQLGMGFLTDGRIDVDGLEPLADDESFWPIYSPCPCLSASVAEAHPEARDALDRIGPSVDGAGDIRELNAAVTIDGRSAQSVAREHLESAGVI